MKRAAVAAVTAAAALGVGGDAQADSARTVDGTVYVDSDGSGTLSPGDETVAGAVVVWETDVFTRADAGGHFTMEVPAEPGIVWVRSTERFRPGAAWTAVTADGDTSADIALRYSENDAAFSFVVAADTHTGIDSMTARTVTAALEQATDVWPPPHFVAIVGDMTQSNEPDEFDVMLRAIAELSAPYVAIPGNHDWYDEGASYRAAFGPPTYSFDAGGVHFIVLNDADPLEMRQDFVATDLTYVIDDRLVAVFTHAPPDGPLVATLSSAGVDYVYTGHQHANRVLDHGGMVELNTQPLAMGGIDQTPAGFRVVELDDTGRALESYHRTIVDEPIATIVYPRPPDTVAPCDAEILAAVEPGSTVDAVWLTLPGAAPMRMQFAGGWSYRHHATTLCTRGTHDAVLSVVMRDHETITRVASIQVGDAPRAAEVTAEWPMLHGNAAHTGRADTAVVPPLETVWARAIGGHVQGGSAVIADGRVIVPVVDYGDGNDGGLVALDLESGDTAWTYTAPGGVRNAPAVAHDVVVAARVDGTVVGLDTTTGAQLWTYELARGVELVKRNIYSAPTIRGHIVHIGIQRELVALDVRTGEALWSTEPHYAGGEGSSYSSPALSNGILLTSFSRGLYGLFAFDSYTGARMWRTSQDVSRHLNASPVTDGDTAYVTNELGHLFAVNLHDGTTRWRAQLGDDGFPWSFSVMGTAALSDGTLFVPSSGGQLHAVDAATGADKWRAATGNGLIRAVHYRGRAPGLAASPIVTGPLVWLGGTDGVLRALDADSGRQVWSYDVGAPILSAPVPAGRHLVVASYDGTVRLMRSADELSVPLRGPDGFGAASNGERGALGTGLLIGFVALRLRRRRP